MFVVCVKCVIPLTIFSIAKHEQNVKSFYEKFCWKISRTSGAGIIF